MNESDVSEGAAKLQLLQSILEPLLEDFRYWFERSRILFESERIDFMSEADQANLVLRVKEASQAVNAAISLYNATAKQVGIDMAAIAPWHQLLMECQAIAMKFRQMTARDRENSE